MTEIPEWVKPGAAVVAVRNGRHPTGTPMTILRVGKKYAIVSDNSRFDATKPDGVGALFRYGPSAYSDSTYLYPADSDAARAVLTRQAIDDNGRKLTVVIEAFVKDPTEERAERARAFISLIRELVLSA